VKVKVKQYLLIDLNHIAARAYIDLFGKSLSIHAPLVADIFVTFDGILETYVIESS
jgi:hypothetical protein